MQEKIGKGSFSQFKCFQVFGHPRLIVPARVCNITHSSAALSDFGHALEKGVHPE
jgi:hypothetical protein